MRASYNSISSARRFSSWLMVVLGLAAYVGLLYGLTMLPLQLEVPLPHWGVAVVPPLVYGLLVVLCVRWPSPLRWLVGTAMLSGLHVLLGLARGPVSAFLDPSLAGRPLPWVLPPPLPELVGLILLLVPLRDLLRARPRSARERTSATGRAPSPVRGRSVPLRPPQPAPAEGRYTPSEAVAVPQVEASREPVVPAAPIAAPVPPGPTLDPDPTGDARRRRAVARAERRREAEIARPARRSDVVLRIALDRIMDQLPPGTFLAPEDEVAASLSDPGYLLIPGQLVVTQLSEGIARVAWSDIVDQFPRGSSGSAAPRSASTSATGYACLWTRWWVSCRTSCSSRIPRRSSSRVSTGSRCRSIHSRSRTRPRAWRPRSSRRLHRPRSSSGHE